MEKEKRQVSVQCVRLGPSVSCSISGGLEQNGNLIALFIAPQMGCPLYSRRKRSARFKILIPLLIPGYDAYLPEYKKEITANSAANSPSLFKLEDGWLAYKLLGKYISIVFECPDQESARAIIQNDEFNLLKKEGKS